MFKNILIISNSQKPKGSALLVAVLIMGVLLSISIALSSLVLREVGITKSLVDSGKAYYAAESGVEEALYKLNTELSGWQDQKSDIAVGDGESFSYLVKNSCNSYPCFDEEEYDVAEVPLEAFYDVLELNETLTVPLFTVVDGEIHSVKNFTVEFFPAFDPSTDLKIKTVTGWDVLRWKVFGMRKDGGKYVTESIGDLTAFAAGSAPNGNNVFANVERPSWFGTVDCDQMSERAVGGANIRCNEYDTSVILKSDGGQICTNIQSRDYLGYVNGEVRTIYDCYDIGKFMEDHQLGVNGSTGLNYLTLTNMMNPAVFDEDRFRTRVERMSASRLYYRVETFEDTVVREYANIVSDGYSGDSKQSLQVKMKRGSYMPVFNFSLYSTYVGK